MSKAKGSRNERKAMRILEAARLPWQGRRAGDHWVWFDLVAIDRKIHAPFVAFAIPGLLRRKAVIFC
jgi:hypothetical protein